MEYKRRTKSQFIKLMVSILILVVMFSIVGRPMAGSAATFVIAFDDLYEMVNDTVLSVGSLNGVLENDDYEYTGAAAELSASWVSDPANGSVALAPDGSFVYTPNSGFIGIDSFVYTATDGTTSDTATVFVSVTGYETIYACLEDETPGVPDGQGDVTQFCQDVSPLSEGDFGITLSFDEIYGKGAGNTRDACAFFDTDMDGNANIALCTSILSDANLNLIYNGSTLYTCKDNSPDTCVPETTTVVNYCAVGTTYSDPFTAGAAYPWDTTVLCRVPYTSIAENATFINACAAVSGSPASNTEGCVATVGEGKAYFTVLKEADPDDKTQKFSFTTNLPTPETGDDPAEFDIYGSGANTFVIDPATFSVTEAGIPDGWELTDAGCVNKSSISEGTRDGSSVNDITASPYESILCTFTNVANIDLEVTKSDGDYGREPAYLSAGETFTYTIDVEYLPLAEGVAGTGATANAVIMTDTLDPNLELPAGGFAPTITLGGGLTTDPSCGYTAATHTVNCTSTSLTAGQKYTISFPMKVKSSAPMDGLIEIGTCTGSGTTFPYSPPWTGTYYPNGVTDPVVGPVDVCNQVSVSTTSYERADWTANNSDSEPTDIANPSAATVINFAATPLVRSIQLSWETTSETNNMGFNLYKSKTLDGKKFKVNKELIPSNVLPGSMLGASYEFIDKGLSPIQTYYYWLEDVDTDGNAHMHEEYVTAQALKK